MRRQTNLATLGIRPGAGLLGRAQPRRESLPRRSHPCRLLSWSTDSLPRFSRIRHRDRPRTSEGQAALWHNRSEPDVSSGDRVVERDARELLRDDECALVDDLVLTVIDLLTFPIQRTEGTARREKMCVSAWHSASARMLGVCNLSSSVDARDEAVPGDELRHPPPHPSVPQGRNKFPASGQSPPRPNERCFRRRCRSAWSIGRASRSRDQNRRACQQHQHDQSDTRLHACFLLPLREARVSRLRAGGVKIVADRVGARSPTTTFTPTWLVASPQRQERVTRRGEDGRCERPSSLVVADQSQVSALRTARRATPPLAGPAPC